MCASSEVAVCVNSHRRWNSHRSGVNSPPRCGVVGIKDGAFDAMLPCSNGNSSTSLKIGLQQRNKPELSWFPKKYLVLLTAAVLLSKVLV
jgi:hypothetical protein